MTATYLETHLAPLKRFLADEAVTDVYINRPGEIFVETLTRKPFKVAVPILTEAWLHRLAKQIAAYSSQGISRASPLLAASLPGGIRAQVIIAPAAKGHPIFAFRRQVVGQVPLEDYVGTYAMSLAARNDASNQKLAQVATHGHIAELFRLAVLQRKNILISGGTSSGKTTFLNSLLAHVPAEERLVLIEDTAELQCGHDNQVGLISSRSEMAEAKLTADELLIASLRLRPDRIILGEIRGSEAFTFLRAINSGHPGSMTTIHADSPSRAIEQLAMLVLQSGSRMRREDVVSYVRSAIDIYVQLGRKDGTRGIEAIHVRTDQQDIAHVA